MSGVPLCCGYWISTASSRGITNIILLSLVKILLTVALPRSVDSPPCDSIAVLSE